MALISDLLRPRPRRVLLLGFGCALAILLPGAGHAGSQEPTFAAAIYVDQQLAGGEPTVMADLDVA